MRTQETLKLHLLSELVGDFIRYWGFRKIHGEIWTVLYLSKKPLSGVELCDLLKASKALISPALKELEAEGLIVQTVSENSKTKRYAGVENVTKVIREVLRRREKPMIDNVLKRYADLSQHVTDDGFVDSGRLESLGGLIQTGQMGLLALTESEDIWI